MEERLQSHGFWCWSCAQPTPSRMAHKKECVSSGQHLTECECVAKNSAWPLKMTHRAAWHFCLVVIFKQPIFLSPDTKTPQTTTCRNKIAISLTLIASSILVRCVVSQSQLMDTDFENRTPHSSLKQCRPQLDGHSTSTCFRAFCFLRESMVVRRGKIYLASRTTGSTRKHLAILPPWPRSHPLSARKC